MVHRFSFIGVFVRDTVSTLLDAHLSSARNPMFGPEVVVKDDVTQWESCLSISPFPLFFALNLDGNALRVYARGYSNQLYVLQEFIFMNTLCNCIMSI